MSVGAFFIVSDVAAVNVALPRIAERLPGGPGIEWVITGYLLALSSSMPVAGWAADRYGKHRVLAVSLLLYAVATALAALAPSREFLVAARVLQGASSGALAPVGQAYVYSAFHPSRRGLALGVWGMVATFAPAIGPLITGAIVTAHDWRWAFGANVPVIVIVALLTVRLVPDDRHRALRALDAGGLALASVAFSGVLIGLGLIGRDTRVPWLPPFLLGVVFLGGFIWRSLRVDAPLVDLRMMTIRIFRNSTLVIWVLTATQIAQLTLIPLQLQVVRGLTPFAAALTVLPAALVAALMMPVGGRLGDRIGARLPVAIGMAGITIAMVMLSLVDRTSPTAVIVIALALHGAGFGLALMPNTVTAMNSLPTSLASQAAVFRGINRQIAAAVGAAAAVAIVAVSLGGLLPTDRSDAGLAAAQRAYNGAFVPMAVLGLVGLVCSRRLPGRDESQSLRQAREDEYSGAL